MKLPSVNNDKEKLKKYTYAFGGINRAENFTVGELETSENVSFDLFPAISAGRARGSAPVSFNAEYEYVPVNGGAVAVKYNEETSELTLAYLEEKENANHIGTTVIAAAKMGRREAARIGNYIIVFPDKVCMKIDKYYYGFEALDVVIEKYHTQTSGEIGNIGYDYIKLPKTSDEGFDDFTDVFKVGDAIKVSVGWYYDNTSRNNSIEKTYIIREIDSSTHSVIFDANSFSELQSSSCELAYYSFQKVIPDIKNLVCFEGRVWGNDADGKIYASKYNDPTNFEYFDFTSLDSYTIETDTPGIYTASAAFSDHVAFFKEDKIHRITGTRPSNFRHTVVLTDGVRSGAEQTLKTKDDIAYFVGKDGIYIYGSGLTQKISEELGFINYISGAAVFYKDDYYISITGPEKTELFGYDTKKRMWFKDGGEVFVSGFKFLGKSCYKTADGVIKTISESKDLTRDIFVTFREILEDDSEQKGWSRLYICARLVKGGKLKAEIDYGFGFEPVGVFTDSNKTVFEIRLMPNRGDKIKLRLIANPSTVITKLMREHYVHGSVF